MIKKTLGYLLIFIGIVILLYPILKDIYIKHEQKKIFYNYTYSFENSSYLFEDLRENVNYEEESQPAKKESSILKDVLGIITISKIDVTLPVYYDATSNNLKKGAAIVKGTAFPPKGNTVIAAHRGRTYGSYFNRLQELEIGDMITLDFNNSSYTYEVYEIFIVEPSEVWVLNNTQEPIITLITCHPQSGTHRLIVRGKIIY
ncbi:class D sortase [Anaerobranca gottschalkii]|uniref:Sortase A n=1 Tax=Anaerobranca gottschalkii DSM 13577 TaxID=1120990 RepID=A0A1H9Z329_9FIRM|nr:class D sortase [Anaerobranca gottschalkii]SES75293.1 sortase A [Anaerobranca gottschalkii DSM 13577]